MQSGQVREESISDLEAVARADCDSQTAELSCEFVRATAQQMDTL